MPTGPYPQQMTYPSYGYGYTAQDMLNRPMSNQPQQNNSNSLMTVLVNSEDEVNNYPVAAGFTVMLVDFSHNKFWLKSTAMNGVPQPPRVFTISEISQQSSTMIATPAAVEEYSNVAVAVSVPVWSGCCETLSIRNTSDQPILVQNANAILTRSNQSVMASC